MILHISLKRAVGTTSLKLWFLDHGLTDAVCTRQCSLSFYCSDLALRTTPVVGIDSYPCV